MANKIIKLIGLLLLIIVAATLFPSVRVLVEQAFLAFDRTTQAFLKLVGIGVMALVAASLISPLESLGWWAGWYGDQVETTRLPGRFQEPIAPETTISRYVIYLDGIGQANFTYLPEGEAFLDQLGRALPDDIAIIRGLMPYSVLNRSLTSDRPFAWFWRLADQMRLKKPGNLLSFLINIRNLFIVTVSADLRYGPIYNRGMAQLMYSSLINHGYQPRSGVPITLIGFSGGGQISMGAAPLLEQALDAPIDVISLGGVFCGRNNALKLEHVYHLAGDKDTVQRLGAILFPRRWRILPLSYWNRAKRHGKVSLVSLGAVGHQNPGGILDPEALLPDGRTNLEQSVDWVAGILEGRLPPPETLPSPKISTYERYLAGTFNHPSYFPLQQSLPGDRYRPIAPWIGRLILPTLAERPHVHGVWFEVRHADAEHAHLVGQVVFLRWQSNPELQTALHSVTHDVYFNDDARLSLRQGVIHPRRLNQWRQVDPLESMAGARPNDDLIVMLNQPVEVQPVEATDLETINRLVAQRMGEASPTPAFASMPCALYINQVPTKVTGIFYALVQFVQPLDVTEVGRLYQVRHFNRVTQQFDGSEDVVLLPAVIPNETDLYASSNREMERSPCNTAGWYIYGAQNHAGQFVVQAIAPRALFRLQPDREIVGRKPALQYLKTESWGDLVAKKGTVSSTLLNVSSDNRNIPWQEGERALLVHNYGGIGGNKREPAAQGPVYFGHFSYGIAEVVREPLSDELRFEIVYFQVYAHNTSGLLSGRHHWSSYMGDRQWGFLGTRPVCDLLIKLESFTGDYQVSGDRCSPLDVLIQQLDLMMARYRIGDGTGATYVGPAHNCAQDSNQAVYAALRQMVALSQNTPADREWLQAHPHIAAKLKQLERLGHSLKRDLLPLGIARADWKEHQANLGSSMEDSPIQQILTGLSSWRTMLPRVASEAIAHSFIQQGATVWVMRTTQVGGADPDIEPIAPMRL